MLLPDSAVFNAAIDWLGHGLWDLTWWQIVLYTLATTHITIAAVTIFLHRTQTHRAMDLGPIPSHFFRFWLWIGTGMVTKEWVAIHRKHHAKCETQDDPHSPQVKGIEEVLWRGAELYRAESKNKETMERYGHGTPDDWIERNLYSRYSWQGVGLMLVLNLALFGTLGMAVWAVQMLWIPITAAGVINGIGHYWGYRNFEAPDASRNIMPWGLIIGGEELHNNHHAHGTSAKFSAKWYEFDIGWCYINILKFLGLAKIKKVAPKLKLDDSKTGIDLRTLQGVITHRYEVMARYADVIKSAAREELAKLKASRQDGNADCGWNKLHKVRRAIHRNEDILQPEQLEAVDKAIAQNKSLSTLVQMRRELGRIWESSSASSEQLLHDLQAWCQRAQQSGIAGLEQFAQRLRRYAA